MDVERSEPEGADSVARAAVRAVRTYLNIRITSTC